MMTPLNFDLVTLGNAARSNEALRNVLASLAMMVRKDQLKTQQVLTKYLAAGEFTP